MPAPHFDRRHLTSPLIWSRRDRRVLRAMADFVQACDSSTHDEKVQALLRQESPSSAWLLRRVRSLDDDA